eukprot:TRINITY_DN7045_c0_g1_i2.p1 TRINITY_DN7045_c0_g1~~TRINITY_DN7045_c0_g1_i2.p1  ORF type:complete len:280 (-),score=44.23 TRINITY_DN7045_c0_g1_i2:197-1036(-)
MSSTSAVALITLGLAGTPSKSILQRRYHQLAREHHPGKAVLRGICPAEATAKFREIHSAYDFLKRHVKHSNPASARDRCVSCGSMALMLNEHRCTAAGIDWLEYAGHPARLRTCMRCKASHKSVLTEAQACKAFEELSSGNDLFRVLEREGCVFRDASETYFERLDLEKEDDATGITCEQEQPPQETKEQEMWSRTRSTCPATSSAEVNKRLSAAWLMLSVEEKRKYHDLATRDRDRYHEELDAFNAGQKAQTTRRRRSVPGGRQVEDRCHQTALQERA